MQLQNTLAQGQYMKLNITPQLIQSMNILQMSMADLAHYIQEHALENPFLDVVVNHETFYTRRKKCGLKANSAKSLPYDMVELAGGEAETLEAALLSQLRTSKLNEKTYKIAKYLVGNLNDDGFLLVPLEEVSEYFREPMAEIMNALTSLQSLDPAGVGARSLQECLCIQILRDPNSDPWAYRIITDYFNELACGKLQHIANGLNIAKEQVVQSLEYIRTLKPRPGLMYNNHRPNYIVPDAVIQKEHDRYVVLVNEMCMPKVSVNRYYYRHLVKGSENKEAKSYIHHNLREAHWLIDSLEQRKATLLRVIEAILQEQLLFLEKGISYLKPMILKTIAMKLNVDESTVSRAIRNKFILTPRGMFELKFFFTNGLLTYNGEAASAKSIKAQIRSLIDSEKKAKPLSDQQITDMLAQKGLQISRRTVMKYREEMHILSSRLRVLSQ
ncbi:RNA polymerase factor sigma-54 [Paenibacillus filicis]|uniref:RNA polymerase factor sigma-54 n=1 Tax=Paenibacillus gyeongsangnamensis TaxID=3388067 RepID=A0ABT4QEC3_9BACL|nr:RNA polymerase factor sigma-54 [Paenibacillus filicis]MCZ8515231.1 RNA polymerase factor sigma-54 [Paenibacillus filicis]